MPADPRRKTKETGEVDSDGNSVVLTDVEKEGDGGIGDESMVSNRIVDPAEVPPLDDAGAKPKKGRGKKAKPEPEPVAVPAEEAAAIEPKGVGEDPPKKKRSRKSA